MKSSTPKAQYAEGGFQIQPLIFDVYLLTPGQDQQKGNWTWLDLWNLLTINVKDKYFHNSKDWLEFIFKCVSHYCQGKFSDLHCSDYWKMHLWNFSFLLK